MNIDHTRADAYHLFVIKGELTEREYDEFNQQIYEVSENDAAHVVLDFAGLSYISSSGLGTLVRLYNLLSESDNKVVLISLSPNVSEVIKQTRMDQIFHLHDDLPSAIAKLDLEKQSG